MTNLQIIANNVLKLKISFYFPFEYSVLHCNIDQNFKGPVIWFPKGLGWKC